MPTQADVQSGITKRAVYEPWQKRGFHVDDCTGRGDQRQCANTSGDGMSLDTYTALISCMMIAADSATISLRISRKSFSCDSSLPTNAERTAK